MLNKTEISSQTNLFITHHVFLVILLLVINKPIQNMKKVIIALCFTAGIFSAHAQTTLTSQREIVQANPNGPKFDFKDGDTYDFKTVTEGPNAEHKFVFTNTGKAPLVIMNATASCSCTVPSFPKAPILPGKTGEVTVSFTTKGHIGPFIKDVYIQSNAMKGTERYTIHIKGDVVAAK